MSQLYRTGYLNLRKVSDLKKNSEKRTQLKPKIHFPLHKMLHMKPKQSIIGQLTTHFLTAFSTVLSSHLQWA